MRRFIFDGEPRNDGIKRDDAANAIAQTRCRLNQKRELKLSENKPPSPEKPPAGEKRLVGLVEVKPEMTEEEMRQAAKELFKQIKGK